VIQPGDHADHITPYDRMALDEAVLIELLAGPTPHQGLVEYFGESLHAELARLARATTRRRPARGRRVYVLPGIMGSQLGFMRGGRRPNDILWLDPVDIAFGRLTELRLGADTQVVALGAMNYTYLKLTLSLRKAGFDAVLLDYDWRRDLATLGRRLAARIEHDGRDEVALIGHSMGGLVARAALTHGSGKRVSQLIMLGTPNAGSLAAVQALRGTYSVVRKIAMIDLRHDAEYLARHVFSTFPGLHELLPAHRGVSDLDLFDPASWPASGPRPDAGLLRAAAGLEQRLASADSRFTMIVGCNRTTATGVALHGEGDHRDFEYEYSLQGDGTVPIELARLPGARHSYVECGHSDMPLADRVIAGTVDLLRSGATQRFAAAPPVRRGVLTRVRDAELRAQYQGKIDWPHMTPEQRRLFLDTLNEPPRGRAHRKPQRPAARPLTLRVVLGDVAEARAAATAVAVLRGVPALGAAADIDERLGGVITDWLEHRVVSGDAGHITPIPRSLQRKGRRSRTAHVLVGLGRFDRLSLDVIEHAAENLARFAQQPQYRSLATVAWGSHSGIDPADSFAAQLRGFMRARAAGNTGLSRVDMHVLTRDTAQRVHSRLHDFVSSRPPGSLRLAPLAPSRATATTRSPRIPGTAHLIVAAESSRKSRETWRASLLTGGSSAAIYSQSVEFASAALDKLDREFLDESLTNARVKALGARLAELVLHPALATALQGARRQSLSIVHDSASSRVPWETLNLRGWVPALEHGLSRRYATADLVPARFDAARRKQRELAVLVIANPTRDLPGADTEAERITRMLGRARNLRITEVLRESATVARVTAEFESGRHDVIHYAGHAFFDAKRPGDSGLVLADGEMNGMHLASLGRLPPLVVFNACESARLRGAKSAAVARHRSRGMQANLGLAETLLRAGVAHYIGTHWPVEDKAATAFAATFYRELLRQSIGTALVKARRAVHAGRSPDWADYVHYGDAEFRLKAR
jgi:pimeloyl-ACP methyl ester carboxylesterase